MGWDLDSKAVYARDTMFIRTTTQLSCNLNLENNDYRSLEK